MPAWRGGGEEREENLPTGAIIQIIKHREDATIVGECKEKVLNMKKRICSSGALFICLLFLMITIPVSIQAPQSCEPSGKIRGKKSNSPQCTIENDVCCIEGELYPVYNCSPPVSTRTKATLTLDTFEKGGDGAKPSKCDNQYHSDKTPVVALSTGWFDHRSRCLGFINIYGNGKKVKAKVVGECDSMMGCDSDHDYQPPCANNVVVASQAVWRALKVPPSQWGELVVTSMKTCLPLLAITILLLTCYSLAIEADDCHPSGRVRRPRTSPPECDRDKNMGCCEEGKYYYTYKCSPPVTNQNKAYMTLTSFDSGGDVPYCDGKFHSDRELVVALSTGWFDNERRCHQKIKVSGNGRSLVALVVDECDSTVGCDADHVYQPPCGNNIVGASSGVWKALGVPSHKMVGLNITWSDA
ncbi:hypothetical protein Tsubulata_035012 [Turnera subulata]|uniref:Ripening-related protein 1 n=1 Tax=Turnera subulata TaxID=218843 RepID=A0A9Q0FW37_9ROSI|nr:hypothetical protein Tsubulata_035012 [Turnera subulata]